MSPQMRFNYRRAKADKEGYYHTRWDRAVPITVIAGSESEAAEKVFTLSGDAPTGRYWTIILDRVDEVSPCDHANSHQEQPSTHGK